MDWLIFGSINITIMVLMFLFLSRRLHRQYNNENFLKEIQQEVNAIVTELNQTTERNVQLLEERIEAVQALAAQLDRRILLARSEESQRTESHVTYAKIKDQRRQFQRDIAREQSPVPSLFSAPVPSAAETSAVLPEPVEQEQIPLSATVPASPPPRELDGLRHTLSRDARKTQVIEMFRAGIASPLIAQHSGMSLGEVELIISLQS